MRPPPKKKYCFHLTNLLDSFTSTFYKSLYSDKNKKLIYVRVQDEKKILGGEGIFLGSQPFPLSKHSILKYKNTWKWFYMVVVFAPINGICILSENNINTIV